MDGIPMPDETPQPDVQQPAAAAEHVAEAHRILSGLRDQHPDLEEAIAKLELALSVLTTKTGGML